MASKIQKLKEDLASLENQTLLIYGELHEQYHKYINLLSQALKKQFILAAYQLCTQNYPHNFLNLSYNQRENLQVKLKDCIVKYQEELLKVLEKANLSAQLPPLKLIEKILSNWAKSDSELRDSEPLGVTEDRASQPILIKNPEHLFHWCKIIETEIINLITDFSKEANHILQEANILPSQLPPQILDMAIQAEESGQPISGNPNLLNVMVETGTKNKDQNDDEPGSSGKITKITAIHLRLAEIEFADPSLTIEHKEIRKLLEKASYIRKQYQKKERECAIAEAESAWRSSWYDE